MARSAAANGAAKAKAGGELALIAAIRGRASAGRHPQLALGIGDDCAILRPPAGHEVLVTTDMSLETRHFARQLHPARAVGHRCLTRGLSDLAAMGARPLAAFLSLALPGGMRRTAAGRAWVDGFLDGLLRLAEATRTPLAGGDTAQAPGEHILADIVLLGSAPRGTALRRSGARAGDQLYVTGSLGGAAAELRDLQREAGPGRKVRGTNSSRVARQRSEGMPSSAVEQDRDSRQRTGRSKTPTLPASASANDTPHPHLFPVARLQAGWLLRERRLATASIDLSDGLSTDLHHLCEESGVGAVIDAAALPIAPGARADADGGLGLALHGGEDYELLFAVRPGTVLPRRLGGVALHPIGTVTRRRDVLLRQNGREAPLTAAGWEHAL